MFYPPLNMVIHFFLIMKVIHSYWENLKSTYKFKEEKKGHYNPSHRGTADTLG